MAFEQRPDSGRLMAAQSKRSEKAPDYWGEIAIDIKDLTNAQVEKNFVTFKLSGWKKQSKSNVTYLSLAIDRRVREDDRKPARRQDDDDVPF